MSTKIFTIYKSFDSQQLNKLESFLNSEYLVPNSIHLELFNFFKDTNLQSKNKELEIFMNFKQINKVQFKMLSLEHFGYIKMFIHLEFSNEKNKINLSSLQYLNFDNNILEKEIKRARKELEISKKEDYYSNIFDDYSLSKIEINQYLNSNKIPFDKLKNKFILQNEALDSFYLWHKVKLICSYYNLKSVLNFEEELLLQVEVENLLAKQDTKYNLAIELYWNIIQVRKNTDATDLFEKLISKLNSEAFKTLHFTDQKEVYQYVIGLCIIMIVRKNQTQFNITLFDLYNEALQKDYLTNQQNFIGQRTFKNIVRCALNNNKLEWTKNILKKAPKFIQNEDLEHALAYNYGVYFYYNKEYKKALDSFSQLPYDTLFYAIDLRTYLIRLYFQLEEIDALFSLIDSFRTFLKRNKTHSIVMITSLRNFLNAIKKLAETNPRDLKKLKKMHKNIEALNPMVEKNWLLNEVQSKIDKLSFLKK